MKATPPYRHPAPFSAPCVGPFALQVGHHAEIDRHVWGEPQVHHLRFPLGLNPPASRATALPTAMLPWVTVPASRSRFMFIAYLMVTAMVTASFGSGRTLR
jgi:hypothetical protein